MRFIAPDLLSRFLVQGVFTRKEFEEETGLSKRQSIRELSRLVENGKLEKTGQSRSVMYRVVKFEE
jgi:predicted HTH transcriptional regulator